MSNTIPLDGFIQIALVVDDIEKAIDTWCTLFDVPRPSVRITPAEPNPRSNTAARRPPTD